MNFNFNISSSMLIASLIWGTIGSGFALYGWRQKDMVPLFGGIALMALSYFIESALIMSLVSVVLIVAIFWLRKHL